MKEKKEAIKNAEVDLGSLDLETAHLTVHGLVKSSGKTMQEIADCIGKTRQTLLTALKTNGYPNTLVDILECLGYSAKLVIETKIKSPKTDD